MLMMNLHSLPDIFTTFSKIVEFYTHATKFRFVFYQEKTAFDPETNKEIVTFYKFEQDDPRSGQLESQFQPLIGVFE